MYDLTQDHPKIMTALHESFCKFAEELDPFGIFDSNYPDDTIHEISPTSCDGYIAHTNGGLRCMVSNDLRSAESECCPDSFEGAILQPYIDSSRVDAADEYIRQCDDEKLCEAWDDDLIQSADEFLWNYWEQFETEYTEFHKRQLSLPTMTVPEWHQSEHGLAIDAEREKLYEITDHWLTEGSEFWYEARAIFYDADEFRNVSGRPELYIFAGVNTDFTYGRERGLDTSFERTIPLDRLTPHRIDVIVDAMADSIIRDTQSRG